MMRFSDMIGQSALLEHLRDAVRTGRVAHAYIFQGEKGMGKKTLADIFAKALQCEKPLAERKGMEPCGVCHSCIMANSGSHPDIITLVPEKANSIGVDEVRHQIVDDVSVKPFYSPRKIYIVPEAHLMTDQAQNALLKTLEEPPAYTVIILLPDNKDMLLDTLISRAVSLQLREVPQDRLREYLMDKELYLPGTGETVLSFARGNIGRAGLISQDEDYIGLVEYSSRLMKEIRDMSDSEISGAAEEVGKNKERKDDYLSFFLMWYRDILLYKAGGGADRLIFKGNKAEISEASGLYSFEKLNQIIDGIKKARSRLFSNVSPAYTFEMLFMAMRP